MVDTVCFHFVFYSIFTVKHIKINAKMYSDSGCNGSNLCPFWENAPVVEQETLLNSHLSCLGSVSRYKILLCWQCCDLCVNSTDYPL